MSSPEGIDLLDKLESHFQALRKERRTISVPLGNNGSSQEIWFEPLNGMERDIVTKLILEDKQNEACAEAMILKCQNEAGVKLWDKGDRRRLMVRISPDVLKLVGGAIIGQDSLSGDELGNS